MDTSAILAVRRTEPEPSFGRPHLWPLILLVLLMMTGAVVILGSPPEYNPEPTPTSTAERDARIYNVSYRFGVFSPTNLRIHAGDTVRWKNESPLPIRITAQIQPGQRTPEFDSVGTVYPNGYYAYTFSIVGTYAYTNASNTNEAGVIIVRE